MIANHLYITGVIKFPILEGIKHCQCMVILRVPFPENERMHCLGWCPIMTPVTQPFINGSRFQILFFQMFTPIYLGWGTIFLPIWRCAHVSKGVGEFKPRNETRDGHPLDVGNFEGATRCFTPRSLPVWLLEGEALVTTRVFSQAKQGVNLGYYIGVYVYIYMALKAMSESERTMRYTG